DNYLAVVAALELSRAEIVQLARNGIDASFLPAADKGRLTAELDQYAAAH
ncbi:adenosine deaminase, partial [Herbaspirillum sp. 3C11]